MGMGLRALFLGITSGAVVVLMVWYYEMRIHFGFKVAVGATIGLYLMGPLLFHYSAGIQRHLVFLPYVKAPVGVDFFHPQSIGIAGGRNFYLTSEPGISIGVWHILPRSLVKNSQGKPEAFWEEALRTGGKNVVLYMHGNSGSRAVDHRVELYVLLQDMDYHVIAFDYRGYADSTHVPPCETGVVADAVFMYRWLKNVIGHQSETQIFIWGHSLGSGVSCHAVADLCQQGEPPKALVLESPFTNLGEEVKNHMLSSLYRYLPAFDAVFVQPLIKNDISFKSDENIARVFIPVAILHAVDDPVVPYFLGEKLYKIARKVRSEFSSPIYFKRFGEGYAHKFICRSPDLPPLLENFFRCASRNIWPCIGFDDIDTHNE